MVLCKVVKGGVVMTVVASGLLVLGPRFAASQEALLDAGWDDTFYAQYLRTRAIASRSIGGIRFSLPVLGFERGDSARGLDVTSARLGRRAPKWPACASKEPVQTVVPRSPDQAVGSELGTWYVATSDFGCLKVVIEGDRRDTGNQSRGAFTPESGSITVDRPDENDGAPLDQEGRLSADGAFGLVQKPFPLISYTRGNLTYSITVACEMAALEFCADDPSLEAMVRELLPVAGSP